MHRGAYRNDAQKAFQLAFDFIANAVEPLEPRTRVIPGSIEKHGRNLMLKFVLAAATAMVMLAQSASAAMDCSAGLDKHMGMVMKMTQASAEKRAALHRMALSGYDHCVAGDEVNAKAFWDMISSTANSK